MTSRVEGTQLNVGELGLRTVRRAQRYQVTYHTYLANGADCHTHQALNVRLVEQYMKLRFFIKNVAICRLYVMLT